MDQVHLIVFVARQLSSPNIPILLGNIGERWLLSGQQLIYMACRQSCTMGRPSRPS